MSRYFIQVFGRVQGVGFRYSASFWAKSLNLTGWVKNCEDGSVQMEVQGDTKDISSFIDKIENGGRFIHVEDKICRKICTIDSEKYFRVAY
ncbi:acylphosphatase [Clostridium sp. JN-1]|jgi:acylphosphatase|uniref:acylphosphatase n=1 Tax=Clostridium sp. JN-1 TaxID=2483110 RepID=UPI000F0BD854|nr:acylphosphatase [Clostridium sp. JN-1]